MFNIKAAIWKLSDLALIPQIKALIERVTNASNWRVGVATNAQDEPILYVPFEKVLIISNYTLAQPTNQNTVVAAGDILDAAIAELAAREQVTRILLEVPATMEVTAGEKRFRVFERAITEPMSTLTSAYSQLPETAFIN